MIKRKRFACFLVAGLMFFSIPIQCQATSYSDLKKKTDKLEKQKEEAEERSEKLEERKKEAEEAKEDLNRQLDKLINEMEELETQIEKKEEELSAKEEELMNARIEENDQYESMKKRIKYMYENGNAQFIDILCESENIGDFLNKAEYISTISEYDRDMLAKFQKVTKVVKEQEEVIRKEYTKMEDMQDQLIEKQDELELLVEEKAGELKELDDAISKNANKIKKLKEAAADALRKQQEALNTGGTAGDSMITGNGFFTHPCPGYSRISSHFGYRQQPLPGASTNHKGMDFAAPTGTPIYAAAAGTVTTAAYSGNAGNMIVINHGNGLVTIYMHCHAMYVSAGQKVTKGQNIAIVGSTGNSTGPHLHFQVNVNGVPTNPLNYL